MADIGKITLNTLEKFQIPYDEIYFGKPEANFYIDDLGINAFENLEKATGYYDTVIGERSFNKLEERNGIIRKSSSDRKLLGEIYWYQHIPLDIQNLFPKFYSYSTEPPYYYNVEKISGIPLSYLFSERSLTTEKLTLLLDCLKKIHSSSSTEPKPNCSVMENYNPKLQHRFIWNQNIYSRYPDSREIYDQLISFFSTYECKSLCVVHGDPVFSNIILSDRFEFKFIDMRGLISDEPTLYGDIMYDYGKIYQSLLGYDFVLNGKHISVEYTGIMIQTFKSLFCEMFGEGKWKELQWITLSLLFTLLPLHNDRDKQDKYYELALNLYRSIR
jgi:hypothetical protein